MSAAVRTTYTTSQVVIGDTATAWRDPKQLLGRNPKRRRAYVYNAGPWGVWLHDAATSTGDERGTIGFYLPAAERIELWGDGELYATGEKGASTAQPVRIHVLTEEERPS